MCFSFPGRLYFIFAVWSFYVRHSSVSDGYRPFDSSLKQIPNRAVSAKVLSETCIQLAATAGFFFFFCAVQEQQHPKCQQPWKNANLRRHVHAKHRDVATLRARPQIKIWSQFKIGGLSTLSMVQKTSDYCWTASPVPRQTAAPALLNIWQDSTSDSILCGRLTTDKPVVAASPEKNRSQVDVAPKLSMVFRLVSLISECPARRIKLLQMPASRRCCSSLDIWSLWTTGWRFVH